MSEKTSPTSKKRILAFSSIAAAALLTGGVAAASAATTPTDAPEKPTAKTNTDTTKPTPNATKSKLKGPHGPGKFGPDSGAFAALHGEYTVKEGTTYTTRLVQSGSVESISPTSISVLSEDGFKETYTIGDTSVKDIVKGDIVRLSASEDKKLTQLKEKPERPVRADDSNNNNAAPPRRDDLENDAPTPPAPRSAE